MSGRPFMDKNLRTRYAGVSEIMGHRGNQFLQVILQRSGDFPPERPHGNNLQFLPYFGTGFPERHTALSEPHNLCARIGGIWDLFDLAPFFEQPDQLSHGLLGHSGSLDQSRRTHPLTAQKRNHAGKRGCETIEAPLSKQGHHDAELCARSLHQQ